MTDFASKRNGTGISYFGLLGMVDGSLIEPSPENLERKPTPDGRRYWIRHDVDDRIDAAWDMARAESDRGIKAVYFFLNTAAYFRWDAFLPMAKDFVRAGHAIGLHNNSVTAAFMAGEPKLAEEILLRDLAYLRQAGDVWITASHGDAWNRHHNVLNYEMFTECRRPGRGSPLERKPLARYGLKHEAYFTPYDVYLSDSGGKWAGSKLGDAGSWSSPGAAIDHFNQCDHAIMQILVHPEWWEPTNTQAKGVEP
jgi:hypothetical protein